MVYKDLEKERIHYKQYYQTHKKECIERAEKRRLKNRDNPNFIERQKQYMKKWYEKNKGKQLDRMKKYYYKNKEKQNIRSFHNCYKTKLLELIKKSGRPIDKCEKCGSTENLELHHLDYKLNLSVNKLIESVTKVRLLCRNCHRKEHRKCIYRGKE